MPAAIWPLLEQSCTIKIPIGDLPIYRWQYNGKWASIPYFRSLCSGGKKKVEQMHLCWSIFGPPSPAMSFTQKWVAIVSLGTEEGLHVYWNEISLHLLFRVRNVAKQLLLCVSIAEVPGVGFGQGVTWCVNDEGRGGQGSSTDLWVHRSPSAKLPKKQ